MMAAFWRAFASCWHPRVLLWTLLPLVPAAAAVAALGWLYWEPALSGVNHGIDAVELPPEVQPWLDQWRVSALRALVGPALVVALSVPLVLLVSLLGVALMVVPALARHVVRQRLPDLQALHGASRARTNLRLLVCVVIAVATLVLSLPLLLVPPLTVLVPWLIWSWLTTRLLAYGVLADFASTDERRGLLHQHRWALSAIGLVCAVLVSLPSLLWAVGAPALAVAPLLGPVLVWVYTAVFVFAALWFAHFLLPRLQQRRGGAVRTGIRSEPPMEAPALAVSPDPALDNSPVPNPPPGAVP